MLRASRGRCKIWRPHENTPHTLESAASAPRAAVHARGTTPCEELYDRRWVGARARALHHCATRAASYGSARATASRFDGYGFNNYGVAEGLAQPAVNQLVEGRGGVYWLATAAGVSLFDPSAGRAQVNAETRPPAPAAPASGKSRFTFFKVGDDEVSNRVQSILADRAGRVWAGTQNGLYFADESADGRRVFRRLELPAPPGAHAPTPGAMIGE